MSDDEQTKLLAEIRDILRAQRKLLLLIPFLCVLMCAMLGGLAMFVSVYFIFFALPKG